MGRFKFNLILLVLIAWLQPSLDLYGAATTPPSRSKPSSSGRSIKNDLSSILRGIKPIPPRPGGPREIPLRPLPRAKGGKKGAQPGGLDLALQNTLGKTKMPVPDQNFEGVPNVDLVLPPDTNGDVGPNHYVQMVNRSFAIWDKNGNLLYGPAANNTLWSGFGGACDTNNDGDPIVLYDQLADRWLMSQFALFASDGFHQCIAISQTGDPTGAWYRYDFLISATKLHDYPKFGVWPDGYYMAVNQFDGNTFAWAGQGVVAFERDKMLVGLPSQIIYFDLFGDNPNFMGMLPSDLDGLIPPPSGSPNYFIEVDDDAWGWPSDRLQVFKFHVDWSNIANATFTGPEVVDLTADGYPFDADMCNFSFNCIPQPGTAQGLDAISDRLMYRLAYRNFGSHEALVVNHAVDADGTDHAGIRWYEIRDPSGTPFVFQAGTYAPDSDNRWMGSTAMDANGNMALGFSVSSGDTFPSIRYTGRLEGDPLGTLSQGEATLIAGGGSQTDSAARWGDYSMLTVDPVDDCTFWYTQEYYASTSDIGWQTRIGSFKFLSCITSPSGTLQGTVTDVATTLPISNAQVVAGASTTFTNASGFYQFSILPVGSYDVTTSALGYGPKTATAVTVTDGGTTVQDFSLVSLPIVTVQGTVTDGSGHGWPLYARIDITNYLGSPIFTNPVTGHYTVDLFQDTPYTFTVNAVSCGYNSVPRVIAPPAGGSIEDFALTVDATTCVVPGYAPLPSIYFEDFETGFGNWTMSGLWNPENEADACGSIVAPFPSSSNGAYYGIDGTCTYNNGITNSGELTMNVPVLLPDTGSATLSFFSYEQTECEGNCPSDNRYVEISTDGGVSWALLGEGNTEGLWHQRVFDLSPYLGQSILIRFRFDTVDDISNDFFGWMVDNLSINAGTSVLISGGLIVGNVYDANTSNPLNGATIDDGSGNMTATFSTPDDPALDDGFYILFSSAGLQTLTASYTGYADEIQTVNVVENSAVIQNFNLLPHQCEDGLDNDGDGKIDFPDDLGCADSGDDDETDPPPPPPPPPPPLAQCADGIDNDGDGKIDFPKDPGCADSGDDDETDPLPPPPPPPPLAQCADGIDNDGDGKIDFPKDPGCADSGDDDETDPPPPLPPPPPPPNNAPPAPELLSPNDGQTGIGTTVVLRWGRVIDPDGDTVTYDRCLRAGDSTFAAEDCTLVSKPTVLIDRGKGILYADLGISSAGFLLIGVVFMGGVAGRRRIIALVALLLMSGMLLVSCGGDPPPPPPPNEVSSIVTGLSPNTTYFWKVVAKDGKGGSANSAVRSFTTKG